MQQIRFLHSVALALALAAGAGTSAAYAQTEIVQPLSPEADRLGQQLRVLAADPRNVAALLEAGLLSARLGDNAAAFAFFARAEALEPSNPRIAAGRAAVLVRMERPGEALRLFQSAEARGLAMRPYAAERGLAYDLLGQPTLAQAEYRTALRDGRDDETVRRHALSLGISGKVDEAMRELDPLLRRSDRAGWRARAFILAMNDDLPGAERIAANMMPGTGASLSPFFRRLATMTPADRAFAVHFGSVGPTQARLADARLAPALPAYVAEQRPVQVARADVTPQPRVTDRRSRRERERDARAARTAARTAPVRTAAVRVAAADLPPVPAPVQMAPRTPVVQPIAAPRAEEIEDPVDRATPERRPVERATPPVQVAARTVTSPAPGARTPLGPTVGSSPSPVVRAASTLPVTPSAGQGSAAPAVAAPPRETNTVVSASYDLATASPRTETRAAEPIAPNSPPAAETPPTTPAPSVAATPEPLPPGPAPAGQEDSVLASIVANITIPAEELEAVTRPSIQWVASPEAVRAAAAPPVAPAPRRAEPVAPKPEPVAPKPEPVAEAPAARKPEAKKPAPAKPAPKKAPAKPDPAKTDPERVWVQVAGGANVSDLPKAWKAVVAKAPAAFKGKTAWTTPLRATNRLLAGPFKTAGEAQGFVNALNREGLSAFTFTSEPGQKVTKLPAN